MPLVLNLAPTAAVVDFVQRCDEALEALDALPAAAEDFVAGCTTCLEGMRVTARQLGRVTPNMSDALTNIQSGISRWER